jgi:hypothetical protein
MGECRAPGGNPCDGSAKVMDMKLGLNWWIRGGAVRLGEGFDSLSW